MDMRLQWVTVLASVLLAMQTAHAGVAVSIAGNQALATVSLSNGGNTYDANVTITFDAPTNLSADELNLSAEIVDPNDTTLRSRLGCALPLLGCAVTVDPAFPVMITVEPLSVPWLFHTSFESGETIYGNLDFRNTYTFEIETSDLACDAPDVGASCTATSYRLLKAPLGGTFSDISSDILRGSVRARGSGGTFSQFLIANDARSTLAVELDKELALQNRVLSAALDDALRTDLLGLLAEVQVAVLVTLDNTLAIGYLDQLISEIQFNAGSAIANTWSSDHTQANDAGEMLSLARTLRFTLLRLQNGQ